MTHTWLVVVLSLGAALGFALSTNLKHSSAAADPGSAVGVVPFLIHTLRHPLWLLGILADVVGLALQIVALHLGGLALVQPLLISGLLLSVLLRHVRSASPRRSELWWALLLTAALAGLLFVVGPSGGNLTDQVDRLPAVLTVTIGVVVIAAAVWVAHRVRRAVGSAALLGLAVGLIYATDAALLKGVSDVAVRGVGRLVTSWQLYAVIAVGVLGLVLCQLAYRAGPLTASQPTIAAVDPVASVVIGVLIFDEHLRHGPWAVSLLFVLVVLLAVSVVKLGRHQAVAA